MSERDSTQIRRSSATSRPIRRSLIISAFQATAVSVVGSVPGFLIPIAMAAVMGADLRTDAFFLALSVASLISAATGATTQQASIPFLIAARHRGDDLPRFLGEITLTLLALAALPTVVLNFSVLTSVRYRAHWSSDQVLLLAAYLWLLAPYIAISVVAGVYSGFLYAEHRFARAAFSPALRSVVVLAGIYVTPWIGPLALVAGYVFGELIRTLYLILPVWRVQGLTFLAVPRSAGAREFARTGTMQMLGSGVLALLPVIDRVMAAQLPAGSITVLEYAERLWQVPVGLVLSGFLVTSLAHWTDRLESGGSLDGLSQATVRGASSLFALSLPLTGIIVLYRQPLVEVIFAGGQLTVESYARLSEVFATFMVAVPIYLVGTVYTRVFLILKRSDWLFRISIVQLITKTACNLLLVSRFGLTGLAASTVMTYMVSTSILMWLFHAGLVKTASHPVRASDHAAG